jgi:hypothetical protein
MRLKSAAEQLLRLKHRRNQQPARDLALFLVLLETGLRVSELLALDRAQYSGKHFEDVKRKGRIRTRKVFLPKEARDALDRYLGETSEHRTGPLFLSRGGRRLERQHVDRLLKQLAAQANTRLPEEEKIVSFRQACLNHLGEFVRVAVLVLGGSTWLQANFRRIWSGGGPNSRLGGGDKPAVGFRRRCGRWPFAWRAGMDSIARLPHLGSLTTFEETGPGHCQRQPTAVERPRVPRTKGIYQAK